MHNLPLVIYQFLLQLQINREVVWPFPRSKKDEENEYDHDGQKIFSHVDSRWRLVSTCETINKRVNYFIGVVKNNWNPNLNHDHSFQSQSFESNVVASDSDVFIQNSEVLVNAFRRLKNNPCMHEGKDHRDREFQRGEVLHNEVGRVNQVKESDCHRNVWQFFSVKIPTHNRPSFC